MFAKLRLSFSKTIQNSTGKKSSAPTQIWPLILAIPYPLWILIFSSIKLGSWTSKESSNSMIV